jgi:uncharacterized protein YcaQ
LKTGDRLLLWSRTGRDTETELTELRWETRDLFAYWAHAASMVTKADYLVHAANMRDNRENDARWWH